MQPTEPGMSVERIAWIRAQWQAASNSDEYERLGMHVESLLDHIDALTRRLAEAERDHRHTIWLWHYCPTKRLYGDDGEMQCACRIDFKRTPIPEIMQILMARGFERAAAALVPEDGPISGALLTTKNERLDLLEVREIQSITDLSDR